MTSITCFGGVNEVGGNKILIEDRGTKIFLDFGMSFGKRAMYFEEFIKPRASNGIVDLLLTGLLPKLEGVYRKDLLEIAKLPIHKEPEVDAIFLSHAHADHANYISFIDEEIPVYSSKVTQSILEAIQEAGNRDFEKEIVNYKKRPLLRKNYKETPIDRKFITFKNLDKIQIDSIEIEPVNVDHSVPGSFGFIIYTTEGPIVYTGDIRMHGSNSEMSEEFIEKASQNKLSAIITEGTKANKNENRSEEMVYNECLGEISKCNGICIADFNFKDADRFKTFYNIAKKTSRKMIISTKNSMMLKKLSENPQLNLPRLNEENLLIFKHRSASGTYSDEDYSVWEREIFNFGNTIEAKSIANSTEKYIFIGGFYDVLDIMDLKPMKNSIFIHSHSEPFNEEMEIDDQRLNNWLTLLDFEKRVQSHCSGHANWCDIKEMLSCINAKTIIPIHTHKPEAFFEVSDNIILPKYGGKIKI